MKIFIALGLYVLAVLVVVNARINTTPGSTAQTTTQTMTTSRPKIKCPPQIEDRPVLVSDLKNCSSYYVCSGGRAIHMSCPKGLHFNPIEEVCDWPYNVNCTSQKNSIVISEN